MLMQLCLLKLLLLYGCVPNHMQNHVRALFVSVTSAKMMNFMLVKPPTINEGFVAQFLFRGTLNALYNEHFP
jgi:hypothetical protein